MSDVGTDIQREQSHLQLSRDQLETKLRAIRLWEPSREISCSAGKRLLSEEMAFSTFQWMWPPAAVMNSLLIESCPFRALHTIFLWILMGYARVQLPREHFWAGTGAQEYMGICGPKQKLLVLQGASCGNVSASNSALSAHPETKTTKTAESKPRAETHCEL